MKYLLLAVLALILAGYGYAQDFGFGDYDSEGDTTSDTTAPSVSAPGVGSKLGLSIKVGGEIALEMTPYIRDFKKKNGQILSFWDMASGKLNFTLSGSNVQAYTAFNFSYAAFYELYKSSLKLSDTPVLIDEAFLRAYIGPVNVEAGFRKLTWGKADSLGPLDVTNPLDYTDLRNISDLKSIKIARPMLHLTWNAGGFSKLEAVFIPNFSGHRFAKEGSRWASSQYTGMRSVAEEGISSRAAEKYGAMLYDPFFSGLFIGVKQNLESHFNNAFSLPNTGSLNNFQTGLRYTTTIGPVDIGGQYFYGNLFLPDFSITGVDNFLNDLVLGNNPPDPSNPYFGNTTLLSPQIKYNRYHQIGFDYAQVVFGFNLRAEFAVNLTEDLSGKNGSVRNPFLAWSFGFDRELPGRIYLNLQCNETIRLLNSRVGSNPVMDCEAGDSVTSTRVTLQLSRKFLRDNLESKVTVIWDIENSGCYVIPAVTWTMGGLGTELSAGIFTGKKDGELGQYWRNTFIRAGIKYSF
jgi:hypothetical protein